PVRPSRCYATQLLCWPDSPRRTTSARSEKPKRLAAGVERNSAKRRRHQEARQRCQEDFREPRQEEPGHPLGNPGQTGNDDRLGLAMAADAIARAECESIPDLQDRRADSSSSLVRPVCRGFLEVSLRELQERR